MRVRYVNISITEELAKKIDEYIEKIWGRLQIQSRVSFRSGEVKIRNSQN